MRSFEETKQQFGMKCRTARDSYIFYYEEVILIMTWKQIEASREARLWITQVVVPLVGIAAMIPEVREAAVAKYKEIKDKKVKKTD